MNGKVNCNNSCLQFKSIAQIQRGKTAISSITDIWGSIIQHSDDTQPRYVGHKKFIANHIARSRWLYLLWLPLLSTKILLLFHSILSYNIALSHEPFIFYSTTFPFLWVKICTNSRKALKVFLSFLYITLCLFLYFI